MRGLRGYQSLIGNKMKAAIALLTHTHFVSPKAINPIPITFYFEAVSCEAAPISSIFDIDSSAFFVQNVLVKKYALCEASTMRNIGSQLYTMPKKHHTHSLSH